MFGKMKGFFENRLVGYNKYMNRDIEESKEFYPFTASCLLARDNYQILFSYVCLGFDTFGPFKLIGGISNGHPTEDEILGAVKFYERLAL